MAGSSFSLPNGTEYYSGGSIDFNGQIYIKPSDIKLGGDPSNVTDINIKVYTYDSGSGYVDIPPATGSGLYGIQDSVQADTNRGSYLIQLVVSYTYTDNTNKIRNKSVPFSLPYNVHKLGVTVNKVSKSALNCNAKDTVYWEAVDATKCTSCTMTNNKGTVTCPAGFNDNNPAPKIYGYFETDNITENTTFKITCDNLSPEIVIIDGYSCQGTVVGSMNVNDGSSGPYEGQSCSQFVTHNECVQKWYSHGCKWQSN